MKHIGFNVPYLTGKETEYIRLAVESGKISGDGLYTKRVHKYFEEKYGFNKVLLVHSCTAALEMAAILLDIKEGDEVIVPSYTFVSTVNAFALRGANIVFIDSMPDNPNMDASLLESLITPRTKAIVPVHYAGVACDMDVIMETAAKHNIYVVEDAAQAIDSYYKGRPLGSIGHMAAFSFHETKNVISGEGGMLVINDPQFEKRAEIIREKGTNRSAFFRGEVDKYNWVDIGSSFLPSDVIAAFLYAQLENIEDIQAQRKMLWNAYYEGLAPLFEKKLIKAPSIPGYATNNAHMFYIVCQNAGDRQGLIEYLKRGNINAVFHYLSLHTSPYYENKYSGKPLPNADMYSDCLIRLPMFYKLLTTDVTRICELISDFFAETR